MDNDKLIPGFCQRVIGFEFSRFTYCNRPVGSKARLTIPRNESLNEKPIYMCEKCRKHRRGMWKYVNRKTPRRKASNLKEARELLERHERLMLKAADDMTAIANRMKKHRDKVKYYRKRIAEMEKAEQQKPPQRKLRL